MKVFFVHLRNNEFDESTCTKIASDVQIVAGENPTHPKSFSPAGQRPQQKQPTPS
jgi:hypothetical protein